MPKCPSRLSTHAIVGVELKKGEHILMDPTAENTKDLLPSYECDQSYLVCRPDGDTIRTSPIVPPEKNMMRVKTTAVLNGAGALEARSELFFDGINDNDYREMFSRMKPDDKQRFFEQNLKRRMPGARLKSLKLMPEDMLDVSSELRAELEFTVEGMTAAGEGKAVVNLPWIGEGMASSASSSAGPVLRHENIRCALISPCGLKRKSHNQAGEGFSGTVSMPSYPPIEDEAMSYTRQVKFKDMTLACEGELKLKSSSSLQAILETQGQPQSHGL